MWSASFYCRNPFRRICLAYNLHCLPLLLILLISVSVPRSFPASALENWQSLALRSSSDRYLSIYYLTFLFNLYSYWEALLEIFCIQHEPTPILIPFRQYNPLANHQTVIFYKGSVRGSHPLNTRASILSQYGTNSICMQIRKAKMTNAKRHWQPRYTQWMQKITPFLILFRYIKPSST